MTYTTVKSDLARKDAKDSDAARCPSTYALKGQWARMMSREPGTVINCTRPASGHRVHEWGSLQWEKSNR